MTCPYCNKPIGDNNKFCPECGQSLDVISDITPVDPYWEKVNKDDSERNRQYRDITNFRIKNVRNRRQKSLITICILLITAIAGIFGVMQFNNYQEEMTKQVQEELAGKTFTAYDSHMEGLGWIHHEYWQFTFKEGDPPSLDYSYIETVGPAEEDEKPVYQGNYNYTLSRSVLGNYTIQANDSTYKLKVNESNVPIGISQ